MSRNCHECARSGRSSDADMIVSEDDHLGMIIETALCAVCFSGHTFSGRPRIRSLTPRGRADLKAIKKRKGARVS